MFDIECAVRQQDGTNSPFRISSVISLDDLRNLVAEKLERFPGHVRLCYRLDLDKAKAGAISIQTEAEFKLFNDRMRDLLVPPVLANGKKSSRIMKKVQVIFEDASIDQQSSNPVGNKVRILSSTNARLNFYSIGCNGSTDRWQQANLSSGQHQDGREGEESY